MSAAPSLAVRYLTSTSLADYYAVQSGTPGHGEVTASYRVTYGTWMCGTCYRDHPGTGYAHVRAAQAHRAAHGDPAPLAASAAEAAA